MWQSMFKIRNTISVKLGVKAVYKYMLGLFGVAMLFSSVASAATVVVTIAPLAEALKPLLTPNDRIITLLPKGQSPHHFQLKPSNLLDISKADMLVRVGFGVDEWAEKAFVSAGQTTSLVFSEVPGLKVLPPRESEYVFGENAHEHESHKNHDDAHDQAHFRVDPHVWLDVDNVIRLGAVFIQRAQARWPEQSNALEHRFKQWKHALLEADKAVAKQLQPVQNVPYLVLHDAFHYFEDRYGLNHVAAIRPPSGSGTGLKQMVALHALIQDKKIKCIFKEPQFSSRPIASLAQQGTVKLGELDPLGDPDTDYPALLKTLSQGFYGCLSSH